MRNLERALVHQGSGRCVDKQIPVDYPGLPSSLGRVSTGQ